MFRPRKLTGSGKAFLDERRAYGLIGEDRHNVGDERFRVLRLGHMGGIAHHFWQGRRVRANNWRTTRHRF